MELPLLDEQDFLCVRCSRRRPTCCQDSEVYPTPGDVRRIAQATGREDFYEYRRPDNPIYAQENDDPFWIEHVFRSDGTRRVLKRQPQGDCTFLGEAGCVLPLETRPLICRLYPFDFTVHGLLDELAQGCPTELLPEGVGLLEALDIRREDALRWHHQLYEELLLEKEPASHDL